MVENQVMSPDELLKALKRYLEKSGETERTVASRIGINHHTPSLAIRRAEAKKRKAGANRILSEACGIFVSILGSTLERPPQQARMTLRCAPIFDPSLNGARP